MENPEIFARDSLRKSRREGGEPRKRRAVMSTSTSKPRSGLALAGFIFVTFCAPLLSVGSMPGVWYAALQKPSWNPPAWLFGPAWTLL